MNTFQVGDQVVVTREHANFNIGDVVTITKVWTGSLFCTKDGGPECSVAITKVQALPNIAKIEALLEAVQTILSQAMYMTTINAFSVCISDLNDLRHAYERIVPPKTTEQLLQERLDAADVLWERFGGEAVTCRGVEVINAYSNAKAAHEASKP